MLVRKKIILMLLAGSIVFAGCGNNKKNITNDKQQIIEADEAFSDMSKAEGMKKAFIEYMDDEGILLRPNHPPIIGAQAIDYLSQENDTSYILTWKPSGAEASASSDLGYTYGIYELQLKDTILKGTYLSIWKKQPDGKWKFKLDTGNEGIKEHPVADSSEGQ